MVTNPERFHAMSEEELEREIEEGRATRQQVDEELQQRQRRDAAEHRDLPDGTQRHTTGGFGSGQGMGTERTGQEPDRPDERGEPRGEDINWPT